MKRLYVAACCVLAGYLALHAQEEMPRLVPPGGFVDPEWIEPDQRWQTVDVTTQGLVPGDEDQTAKIQALVDAARTPTILYFPPGTYRFGKLTITKSDLLIRGAGAGKTCFKATQDGTAFLFQGAGGRYDYKYLAAEYQPRQVTAEVPAGSKVVPLADTKQLAPGDLLLVEEDLDAWTYDAARRGRGGVFRIEKVEPHQVTLDLPLALGLDRVDAAQKNAIAAKLKPVRNVGIEGVRIELPDQPGPKGSAVHFKRVDQGMLRDVECWNPSMHHVEIAYSRGVIVRGCYFEEAKQKGGGGFGYGVLFRDLSTRCKAENNILKDLRHALATEVGANYCVFGYNLIVDRVRDRCHGPDVKGEIGTEKWINNKALNGMTTAYITSDVAAHGNFPHHILFEGNIFYNGVVDLSHKTNGPHFFFRNRALGQPKKYGGWQEGAGLVVMGENDRQVLAGNHLLNGSAILLHKADGARTSQDSYIAANIVKDQVEWGAAKPGAVLPPSLYLKAAPAWWSANLPWPAFGPGVKDSATNRIPAQVRWEETYRKKGLRE